MRSCLFILAVLLTVAPVAAAPRDVGGGEPTAAETVKAALAYAALHPDRLEGLRTRAAVKELVPTVAVKARTEKSTLGLDKYDYLSGSPDEKAEEEKATGEVLELEVGATWNLPGLVYNAEVLDVNALQDQQRELARVVLDTYYARRRLQLKMAYGNTVDAETRAIRELELEQLTSTLDVLTGGSFSRKLHE